MQTAPRDSGARFLVMAASLIVVIAGIKAASSLILPLLVALFLAMISLPLQNWMVSRKVPTALAVPLTIFVALAMLSAVVVLIGDSVRDFTAEAPRYRARLEGMTSGITDWLSGRGITVPDRLTAELVNPGQALDLITRSLRGIAAVLSNVFLVLLTIVFILSEAAGFPAKLEAAFGRRESSERFEIIKHEVQRYLGIKSIVSLATGGLVSGALAIIGVDQPLLWGTLAFLLNYIPNLGSIIAAIPPVLLALVQLGWGRAIAVAVTFAAVNVVLGNIVEPHLMGRKLGLSTLVVFLSLVFWGWVWGPVGMLLSVPLTMIVKILLENTPDMRWLAVLLDAGPPEPTERARKAAVAPPGG